MAAEVEPRVVLLDFGFTAKDTEDGSLRVEVKTIDGSNSVLSKLRVAIWEDGP